MAITQPAWTKKGRLKIPADFKRVVDERYGTQFYITSRDGKERRYVRCRNGKRSKQKMAEIPNFNPAKKKLLNYVNYYGQAAEMDAQGRVLIPQVLREKAKTVGDVVVFGMQTYLEVANREPFVASHGAEADDRGRRAGAGEFQAVI